MALQIRRGTNASRLSIAFSEGELVYSTDTKKLYVGDGTTLGGVPVSSLEESSVTLGGNIDLNSNSITGLGNINIDGDITITGVNDVATLIASTLSITDNILSNLIPLGDISLGSISNAWSTLYVHTIVSEGVLYGEVEGNVRGTDSTILVDAVNGTVPAENITGVFTDINMGNKLSISGSADEVAITNNISNGDLVITCQGAGTIKLNVPVQTTVGLPGAASALPETPSTYIKIKVGGNTYVIPAYAAS
jgi:hypothetical protein